MSRRPGTRPYHTFDAATCSASTALPCTSLTTARWQARSLVAAIPSGLAPRASSTDGPEVCGLPAAGSRTAAPSYPGNQQHRFIPPCGHASQAAAPSGGPSMFSRTRFGARLATIVGLVAVMLVTCGATAWGQTNPTAQSLPYSQDFSGLAWTSTTYPAGWQGGLVGSLSTSFPTTGPTADAALTASGGANSTAGNVYNYDGEIGFVSTSSSARTVLLAVSTLGKSGVSVTYDVMTMRNPWGDGSSSNRIEEVALQYRVGTSGSWTTVTGTEYRTTRFNS